MINKKFYPEGYIIKTEDFIRLEVISKDDDFLPFRLSEKVNKVKSNDFRYSHNGFFQGREFNENQIKMFDRNNINVYRVLSSFIEDVLKDRLKLIGFYNPNIGNEKYWYLLPSLKLITFKMIDDLLRVRFTKSFKLNNSDTMKSKWVNLTKGKQTLEIEQILINFLVQLNCNVFFEYSMNNTVYISPGERSLVELKNKVNVLFKRLR